MPLVSDRLNSALLLIIIAVSASVVTACNRAPEGTEVKTGKPAQVLHSGAPDSREYLADTNASYAEWQAARILGEPHSGKIKLLAGRLHIDNTGITGGSFAFYMPSMQLTDPNPDVKDRAKLLSHLKGPDFFNTDRYPAAKFEITAINPIMEPTLAEKQQDTTTFKTLNPTHTLTGNLTLRDSTRGISFPARIEITDSVVGADARFIIRRTDWGLNYGSEASLGNQIIRPEVKITLSVKAKP